MFFLEYAPSFVVFSCRLRFLQSFSGSCYAETTRKVISLHSLQFHWTTLLFSSVEHCSHTWYFAKIGLVLLKFSMWSICNGLTCWHLQSSVGRSFCHYFQKRKFDVIFDFLVNWITSTMLMIVVGACSTSESLKMTKCNQHIGSKYLVLSCLVICLWELVSWHVQEVQISLIPWAFW